MSASALLVGLQGAFTHQDFAGHKGTIRTGDVQVSLYSALLFLSDSEPAEFIHGFILAKHK